MNKYRDRDLPCQTPSRINSIIVSTYVYKYHKSIMYLDILMIKVLCYNSILNLDSKAFYMNDNSIGSLCSPMT